MWHNNHLPGRLVPAVEFSNPAAPLSDSRVAGDSFQREIVTLHHCQSSFMIQTNIHQHSETVAVHHLGVAYQSLAQKTCACDGGQIFKSRRPCESFKSGRGHSFQREIVTLHHCQSPFMTQTNIHQHSEAVAVHHLGVACQYLVMS